MRNDCNAINILLIEFVDKHWSVSSVMSGYLKYKRVIQQFGLIVLVEEVILE